jgi:hypothetical protein
VNPTQSWCCKSHTRSSPTRRRVLLRTYR